MSPQPEPLPGRGHAVAVDRERHVPARRRQRAAAREAEADLLRPGDLERHVEEPLVGVERMSGGAGRIRLTSRSAAGSGVVAVRVAP